MYKQDATKGREKEEEKTKGGKGGKEAQDAKGGKKGGLICLVIGHRPIYYDQSLSLVYTLNSVIA